MQRRGKARSGRRPRLAGPPLDTLALVQLLGSVRRWVFASVAGSAALLLAFPAHATSGNYEYGSSYAVAHRGLYGTASAHASSDIQDHTIDVSVAATQDTLPFGAVDGITDASAIGHATIGRAMQVGQNGMYRFTATLSNARGFASTAITASPKTLDAAEAAEEISFTVWYQCSGCDGEGSPLPSVTTTAKLGPDPSTVVLTLDIFANDLGDFNAAVTSRASVLARGKASASAAVSAVVYPITATRISP